MSVIVIFLNAERFLGEAIDSVFAQTCSDWELLLVDDGSTDQSTRIALDHAARNPERVRYLDHQAHANRGMSASRNLGIVHATGRYVAFLDADDVWLPRKLEEQIALLDAHPDAAMVYGLSEYWYSWTGRHEDQRDFTHDLGVESGNTLAPPSLLNRFFFAKDAAIPGPTDILVRRAAIERVGGFEEAFRGSYEDEAFYAKIGLSFPVLAVDTRWDRYRQHPGSASSSVRTLARAYAERRYFLRWLKRYLAAQGVTDRAIQRALEREIWRYRLPRIYGLWARYRARVLALCGRLLPATIRWRLWATWTGEEIAPPVGSIRFGSLRRLTPMSRQFGFDRGKPIDRYYIEGFLAANAEDVQGRVLEIADDKYTRQFGGHRVASSTVLHLVPGNPKATIVGDLRTRGLLPDESFDCIILTQTLQFIDDAEAALQTVYTGLKPGGVVLATLTGIGQISRYDADQWGFVASHTVQSATRLFSRVFPADCLAVASHGNVLAATALLYGLSSHELDPRELDQRDAEYPVIVTVRGKRPH